MELIQQFHSSQIQTPIEKEHSWFRFTIPLLCVSLLVCFYGQQWKKNLPMNPKKQLRP